MDERKSIFELPHVRQNPEAIKEELEDALKQAKGEDRSQKIRVPMWVIEDALALLKEHEPILLENQHKPYGISTNANSPWISRCPKCGKKVEGKQTKFCKYCGQAVKWE